MIDNRHLLSMRFSLKTAEVKANQLVSSVSTSAILHSTCVYRQVIWIAAKYV